MVPRSTTLLLAYPSDGGRKQALESCASLTRHEDGVGVMCERLELWRKDERTIGSGLLPVVAIVTSISWNQARSSFSKPSELGKLLALRLILLSKLKRPSHPTLEEEALEEGRTPRLLKHTTAYKSARLETPLPKDSLWDRKEREGRTTDADLEEDSR